MDLMKIGLYGLAGFGAYAAYEHFSKKGAAASVSTVPPITTDEATSSFTGTNWQQAGRNRETMWQNGGVFSNACGGYSNANGARPGARRANLQGTDWQRAMNASGARPGARRANLQGTDWQTSNMSNACGGCA